MYAVKGFYDGTAVKPQETIPFTDDCEVVITFLRTEPVEARDINGFCPAHAAFLKQAFADLDAGKNVVYHELLEDDIVSPTPQ
jgi:hypothetical protein